MSPNKRPLLIGITGNIGSGKSTFCKLLAEQGLTLISADQIAQQHLDDPIVITALVKRYSSSILVSDRGNTDYGKIDRKLLADIVFNSAQETNYLNSLIHPLVLHDIIEIVDNCWEPYLGFEIPLLFETGLQACFDYLILVYTPLELRLQRLVKRHESREKALKRMQFQIPDEDKLFKVDLAIDNSGSISQLTQITKEFMASISSLKHMPIRSFNSLIDQPVKS